MKQNRGMIPFRVSNGVLDIRDHSEIDLIGDFDHMHFLRPFEAVRLPVRIAKTNERKKNYKDCCFHNYSKGEKE